MDVVTMERKGEEASLVWNAQASSPLQESGPCWFRASGGAKSTVKTRARHPCLVSLWDETYDMSECLSLCVSLRHSCLAKRRKIDFTLRPPTRGWVLAPCKSQTNLRPSPVRRGSVSWRVPGSAVGTEGSVRTRAVHPGPHLPAQLRENGGGRVSRWAGGYGARHLPSRAL